MDTMTPEEKRARAAALRAAAAAALRELAELGELETEAGEGEGSGTPLPVPTQPANTPTEPTEGEPEGEDEDSDTDAPEPTEGGECRPEVAGEPEGEDEDEDTPEHTPTEPTDAPEGDEGDSDTEEPTEPGEPTEGEPEGEGEDSDTDAPEDAPEPAEDTDQEPEPGGQGQGTDAAPEKPRETLNDWRQRAQRAAAEAAAQTGEVLPLVMSEEDLRYSLTSLDRYLANHARREGRPRDAEPARLAQIADGATALNRAIRWPDMRHEQVENGLRSGTDVDDDRLFEVALRDSDPRPFQRREELRNPDIAIALAVDCSGSMGAIDKFGSTQTQRYQAAARIAATLWKACQMQEGVHCTVFGYDAGTTFEGITNPSGTEFFPGKCSAGGGTDTRLAIHYGATLIQEQFPDSGQRYLILLSDGGDYRLHDMRAATLRAARMGVKVLIVCIGSEADPKAFFQVTGSKYAIHCPDMGEVLPTIGRFLSKQFQTR